MSDTPSWCKTHLVRPSWRIEHSSDFFNANVDVAPHVFDLALFSRMDASLVLYGTYAFWATYIAQKRTYLPLDYLGAKERHNQVCFAVED